jgi:hypothetical protein
LHFVSFFSFSGKFPLMLTLSNPFPPNVTPVRYKLILENYIKTLHFVYA